MTERVLCTKGSPLRYKISKACGLLQSLCQGVQKLGIWNIVTRRWQFSPTVTTEGSLISWRGKSWDVRVACVFEAFMSETSLKEVPRFLKEVMGSLWIALLKFSENPRIRKYYTFSESFPIQKMSFILELWLQDERFLTPATYKRLSMGHLENKTAWTSFSNILMH